jgi:hypothetical protein
MPNIFLGFRPGKIIPDYTKLKVPDKPDPALSNTSVCESGSVGYVCFWVSRIRILLSSSKNSKKNLDSYSFVTSLCFLSMKNYLNTPSKSNKQKNLF